MPIGLMFAVAEILAVGFLVLQGGPDLPWRIVAVLAVYVGSQVTWYSSNHNWPSTHRGLFVLALAVPYLIGGVCLLVSLSRSFRRKDPPSPERPSIQR